MYGQSEEGRATGLDLVGDDNGRAMFQQSNVPQVRARAGRQTDRHVVGEDGHRAVEHGAGTAC